MKRIQPFHVWFPGLVLVVGLSFLICDVAYYGDLAVFLILMAAFPISVAILIGIAAINWRRWRFGVPTLALFAAFCWWLYRDGYDIRAHWRWLLHSSQYKAALASQPPTGNSELRHLDWDGWGMAGQDTEAYLVFDPMNSLENASKHKMSGRLSGIPCGVWYVRRLENQWYYAVLYTNNVWDSGNPTACYDGN